MHAQNARNAVALLALALTLCSLTATSQPNLRSRRGLQRARAVASAAAAQDGVFKIGCQGAASSSFKSFIGTGSSIEVDVDVIILDWREEMVEELLSQLFQPQGVADDSDVSIGDRTMTQEDEALARDKAVAKKTKVSQDSKMSLGDRGMAEGDKVHLGDRLVIHDSKLSPGDTDMAKESKVSLGDSAMTQEGQVSAGNRDEEAGGEMVPSLDGTSNLPPRERKAGCRNFYWKTFTSC
ncbi:hypothetical protein MATL_G00241670 [Megalops atlanticus]|uniref:Somatostatin/Cortistatin C-terminal domain-containing protein n=1 Tax=Megalops atlanticus TaxID=7932 RepID=A0A9D3T1Q1_MEGAT|nr:hypothetical protein MATL_G00241670 [Megalops atlanticus]